MSRFFPYPPRGTKNPASGHLKRTPGLRCKMNLHDWQIDNVPFGRYEYSCRRPGCTARKTVEWSSDVS